nr:hypothetical protein [Bifidobacterium pseudolongum]
MRVGAAGRQIGDADVADRRQAVGTERVLLEHLAPRRAARFQPVVEGLRDAQVAVVEHLRAHVDGVVGDLRAAAARAVPGEAHDQHNGRGDRRDDRRGDHRACSAMRSHLPSPSAE